MHHLLPTHTFRLIALLTLVLTVSMPCIAQTEAGESALTPSHLRCEYLENPLGIDVPSPRLGWWLASDARGQQQSAYQIWQEGSHP